MSQYTDHLTLRITPQMKDGIKHLAKSKGIKPAEQVRRMLENHFRALEIKEKHNSQ